MAKKENSKSQVQSSKSNELIIQFVGKKTVKDEKTGKEKRVLSSAPAKIINGNLIIELPSSKEQKTGFTHKNANFLIANYSNLYKKKKS